MPDECITSKLRNELIEIIDEQISDIDVGEMERTFETGDELSKAQHMVIQIAHERGLHNLNKIKTFVEQTKSC